ncbi:MAG: hypothetical protein HY905_12495 [Deltaproteobacteria bacterium]|nr:hypothetical protein [Deltaproteobacteria bacterium]
MPDNNSPLKTDEHLVALRGMWDEMKLLNRKIDAVRTDLSARIDQTPKRFDALRLPPLAEAPALTHALLVLGFARRELTLLAESARFANRRADIALLNDRLDRIEQRLTP